MNREETAECIAVMQDHVDGEHIQFTSRTVQEAWTTGEPEWQWALYKYRRKPRPIEGYVRHWDIHAETDHCAKECVHVREVL